MAHIGSLPPTCPDTAHAPSPRRARRGIATVLAMLYLMLFSVLAIGFCAASMTAVKIAENERSAADAQAAAESGMQFMRARLGRMERPPIHPHALLAATAQGLGDCLNGTPSMNGKSVVITGNVIFIPSSDDFVTLDPATGAAFQTQLAASGGSLWVKVIGRSRDAAIHRAIQMRFDFVVDSSGSMKLRPIPSTYAEVSP